MKACLLNFTDEGSALLRHVRFTTYKEIVVMNKLKLSYNLYTYKYLSVHNIYLFYYILVYVFMFLIKKEEKKTN